MAANTSRTSGCPVVGVPSHTVRLVRNSHARGPLGVFEGVLPSTGHRVQNRLECLLFRLLRELLYPAQPLRGGPPIGLLRRAPASLGRLRRLRSAPAVEIQSGLAELRRPVAAGPRSGRLLEGPDDPLDVSLLPVGQRRQLGGLRGAAPAARPRPRPPAPRGPTTGPSGRGRHCRPRPIVFADVPLRAVAVRPHPTAVGVVDRVDQLGQIVFHAAPLAQRPAGRPTRRPFHAGPTGLFPDLPQNTLPARLRFAWSDSSVGRPFRRRAHEGQEGEGDALVVSNGRAWFVLRRRFERGAA